MTEEKKGPLEKLKENITDKDEQLAIISNFVRLGVLVWSGFILTLNYITIPGWVQNKIEPTFIASVFTGTLSTYGIATAKKRGDGTFKSDEKPLNKKEVEALLAQQSGNYQTIRIETPLRIENAEIVDPKPKK